MSATLPPSPLPEPTHERRPHPLAHLHNKTVPPIAPSWLAAACMVWHTDPRAVEDPARPADETFNAAWSRLFGETWPEPPAAAQLEPPYLTEIPAVDPDAGELATIPPHVEATIVEAAPPLEPIRKFENHDALYNLFPAGRIVIVYASSAMAICLTDVDAEAIPEPIAELGELEATQVDPPQLQASPAEAPPDGDKPT